VGDNVPFGMLHFKIFSFLRGIRPVDYISFAAKKGVCLFVDVESGENSISQN
jgi:hypothetical protein